MNQFVYFPGCSVKGTGKPYDESLQAVFHTLGLGLNELDDWNCCGATAYMSIDEDQAAALAGRNLAMAEAAGENGDEVELLTPCNACYLVLLKTQHELRENARLRARTLSAMESVGLHYRGTVRVRHPIDVLVNDIGLEALKKKVSEPLDGLKVAPYYGCQIVRPYALFDSQANPQTMDRLLQTAGAEVIDYPFKTRCCGGSQTGTLPEVGQHLVYELLQAARSRGAEVIATICPLCQFNLEAYQDRIARTYPLEPIPVVYFTQLLGLAMGIDARRLGLHRALVPADVLVRRRAGHVV